MNLTCESCKHAPATHLLVADLHSRRIKSLSCRTCGERDRGALLRGYQAWLYKITLDSSEADGRCIHGFPLGFHCQVPGGNKLDCADVILYRTENGSEDVRQACTTMPAVPRKPEGARGA